MKNTAVVIPTVGPPFNRSWIEAMSSFIPIIVVFDGDALVSIDGVTTLVSPQKGFAGAVNIGIRHAQLAGYTNVLVLNDDAIPNEGCIEGMISSYESTGGLLSPIIVEPKHTIWGYRRSKWGRFHPVNDPNDAVFVPAVCLLMPSWSRFDEGYVHGFEDFELCRRFRQMGLAIRIDPMLNCFHRGGGTLSRRSDRAQYGSSYGQLRFEGLRWSAMVIALQLAQVCREGAHIGRFKAVGQAVFDFYCERAMAIASPRAGSSRTR